MDDYPDSIMHRLAEEEGGVNGKTAFDAMRLGDIAGIEVVNNYIKYVSCGLINLVNALQPEIICIGGGICNEGDTLMEPLRRYVQHTVETMLSKRLLRGDVTPGQTVTVDAENGELVMK